MDKVQIESRVERLADGRPVVVAAIRGRANLGTAIQIEAQVMAHFQAGVHHLVLDCSHLDYLNSSGTALMVKLADTFRSAGGGFLLANLARPMVDLVSVLGLQSVLEIAADVPEALRRFEG